MRSWILKTDEDGFLYYDPDYKVSGDDLYINPASGNAALPAGTITVRETAPPSGYLVNDTVWTVIIGFDTNGNTTRTIYENGTLAGTMNISAGQEADLHLKVRESRIRGGVSFTKRDADLPAASGDASLAGAQITIYANEAISDGAVSYGKDQAVMTVTTNAAGAAATGTRALPSGSYYAKETKAPEGYEINTGWNPEFTIGGTAESDGAVVSVTEVLADSPETKDFTIIKNDDEAAYVQGDASFTGIMIAVVNNSANSIFYGGRVIDPGQVAVILTLDASGSACAAGLPYGRYTAYELRGDAAIEAGETYAGSMKLGSSIYANGSGYLFRDQSQSVTLHGENGSADFTDTIVRGGAAFVKIDRETGGDAQSRATVEDAKIDIYNNSAAAVMVNGTEYAAGAKIMTLTTDENGKCATKSDALPYGTYYAAESEESAGYVLNSSWRVDFQIREDGKTVDTSAEDQKVTASDNVSGWLSVTGGLEGKAACLPEQIRRADISFIKISVDGRAMSGIPFKISRLDQNGDIVESHIIVTDENGRVNTKNRPKNGGNVNSLDEYVVNGRFTDDSALSAETGIWFGEEDGASRDEGRGSLVYADYLIEEIRCEANAGQDMLKQYLFEEQLDEEGLLVRFEDGETIDLAGIFIDLIIHPESDLRDNVSGSRSVSSGSGVTVTDIIRYDNLNIRSDYRVKTEIFYVDEEGNAAYLGENTVSFKPERTDSSETSQGSVMNSVTVDTSDLKTGYLAAVDTFYVVNSEGDVELTVHNRDLSEERQKLYIPWIGTTAVDTLTGDHIGTASETASVTDTVTYKGLADEKMYLIKGTLRFADTGEAVTGKDGQPCSAAQILRVSYSAESCTERAYGVLGPKDGEVVMPAFEFDASELGGRTLVVTEVLYDYDKYDETADDNQDAVIASHYDLKDESQTIRFMKVVTQAADSFTEDHTGTVTDSAKVTDHVTITNAVIGQEYTVNGKLVYKTDFIDRDGVEHKEGEVIAVHGPVEVQAEDTTVELDLEFETDSTMLEGASGVVFEDVWHNGVEIAVHHDLESEEQTVGWPGLMTSARDEETDSHVGLLREEVCITDTVTYENLMPGSGYEITGRLYDQATGEVYLDDLGNEVTASTGSFTVKKGEESGTKELQFIFPGTNLEGTTVVVSEDLMHNGIKVAAHSDINDHEQSVYFPKISTSAKDAKTLTHEGNAADKTVTIIDTIEYESMAPGAEICFTGTLYDKVTGEALKDENGNEFVSESMVVIRQKDGTAEVVFELPGKAAAGHTIVVFEDALYVPEDDEGNPKEPVVVARHRDIDDEAQAVTYPQIIAKGAETGDTANPAVFLLMAAAAAFILIVLLRYRKS